MKTFLLFPLLFGYTSAFSQWKTLAIMEVSEILTNANRIYAGTKTNGIFVSEDQGESFIGVGYNFPGAYVFTLEIHKDKLYAGTMGKGVYVYDNLNEVWKSINLGLTDTVVRALASDGNKLYAGAGGNIYCLSSDESTWSLKYAGTTSNVVYSFAIKKDTLIAGYNRGLSITNNSGNDWERVNLIRDGVRALIFRGSLVFAGNEGAISVSKNNGVTWSIINSSIRSFCYTLAQTNDYIFFGDNSGVHVSGNNGISWQLTNQGMTSTTINDIATNTVNIFASASDGTMYRMPFTNVITTVEKPLNSEPIAIFPVPTKNILEIHLNDLAVDMVSEILTIDGLLLNRLEGKGSYNWDLSTLKNGIYIMRTTTSEGQKFFKIIKE